jgi:hypothetical protein
MKQLWNDIDRENRRSRRRTCPSAALSATNPTWTDLGANLGLRGEKPATNRLSCGKALSLLIRFEPRSELKVFLLVKKGEILRVSIGTFLSSVKIFLRRPKLHSLHISVAEISPQNSVSK